MIHIFEACFVKGEEGASVSNPTGYFVVKRCGGRYWFGEFEVCWAGAWGWIDIVCEGSRGGRGGRGDALVLGLRRSRWTAVRLPRRVAEVKSMSRVLLKERAEGELG